MAGSNPAALDFAQDYIKAMLAANPDHGFEYELCKTMTIVSASLTFNPRTVSRLTVTRTMCNPSGTLHGGAISTLFDVCTTVTLATARRWEIAGVTRTLSTTCLLPVYPGEEIEIEGEVVQIGKRLAHILAKMTLVRNGRLVATGVHDKANVDPPTAMSGQSSKL